jgi:3-deoxy-manno-octulosonate cytidylyltransferase (CMP-KDO synthetase)
MKAIKIAAVIPARLASSRFPRKVIHDFLGLPMLEHVRIRAEISKVFNAGVYVATCDREIYDLVKNNGGNSIMTSESHLNGTSRVAEAIRSIDCTHVLVLQADEPLILPFHLKEFIKKIQKNPQFEAWNAIADIHKSNDLIDKTIVKCAVNQSNRILFCFRGSPFISEFNFQSKYVKKMLGLIAFRKNVIQVINEIPADFIEINESIEQMRVISSIYKMCGINLGASLPSVNLISDADLVLSEMSSDKDQLKILKGYC